MKHFFLFQVNTSELIVKNLRLFVESNQLSDRAFERLVGWSNGFYGKVKNNGTSFSIDKLAGIIDHFPELNINWLCTGKGNMILSGTQLDHMAVSDRHELIADLDALESQVGDHDMLKTCRVKLLKLLDEIDLLRQELNTVSEKREEALQKIKELLN